jgi:hypothetical protein
MRFRSDDEPSPDVAPTDALEPKARIDYRVAWVFDISQVEPLEPLTTDSAGTPPAVTAELSHFDSLRSLITAQGLTLTDAAMTPGQYGYTDGRTITLATGLTPADTFSTLILEYAHAT